jgi:hypothetical protein
MSGQELLATIEEGVRNGRIAPYLAAYITAEILGAEARAAGYDRQVRMEEPDER